MTSRLNLRHFFSEKRKKGDGSDLSDAVDVSDDDFVQVSSEDEAENYDSDKDPGWTPFGVSTYGRRTVTVTITVAFLQFCLSG